MLKVDGSNWCFDKDILKKGAVDYFSDLFAADTNPLPVYGPRSLFPLLDEEARSTLDAPVTEEEVK